jgi:phosphoribosyl 1,2-cyclic phosphodiesterase
VGLSAKQIVLRLEQRGIDPDALAGIFLTHEHSDHARGLDVFMRKRDIPVYANALTKEALEWGIKSEIRWKVFQTGQPFEISDLSVTAFPIPHDAAEPVGFIIESSTARFGLLTDVGYITQSMRVHLKGSDALFIEANYDEDLLEADTKRPWATKQRISSRHGHLSNTQAGELIADVGCEKLSCVLLGHLSSDCNNAKVATETIRPLLLALKVEDLICADQHQPTEWFEFGIKPTENEGLIALSGDLRQTDLF